MQQKYIVFTISLFIIFGLGSPSSYLNAQTFTQLSIDDPTYSVGLSFVDFDKDGDLDISYNWVNGAVTTGRTKLFRNDGNDIFTEITTGDLVTAVSNGSGQTWADYDNDGKIDVYITNNYWADISNEIGCALYRNEGAGNFTRITDGDISSENQIHGWGAAWGDYNNDGFVDLYVLTPTANVYPDSDTLSNFLFDNSGDGTFSNNTTSPLTNNGIDAYTNPTWSDYDQDGDLDVVATAGPVTTLDPDYFFKNQLAESGTAIFIRESQSNYATESRDGQVSSWTDYDNDGDLDLYVSNFSWQSGKANDFFQNNGDGTFTKITAGNIVTDANLSAGHIWGDLDNDGDLDLYVSNSTSPQNFGGNDYYQNNGYPNYTFTKINTGDFVASNKGSNSAVTGDYDNDGDLDLFVSFNSLIGQPASDALYRNDLENGNHWINLTCIGAKTSDLASAGSNKSGIGTKVRIKATLFGNTYWQMRVIGSQRTNVGQNSLRVHFGLGDATQIDSLVLEWPSGIVDIYENVNPDHFYQALEGQGIFQGTITDIDDPGQDLAKKFELFQNYPNPSNQTTTIAFSLVDSTAVTLKIFDIKGQEVKTLLNNNTQNAGRHEILWDGRNNAGTIAIAGQYFYQLSMDGIQITRQLIFSP